MGARHERRYRLAFPETFPQYARQIDTRLQHFKLPMDTRMDIGSDGNFILQV